MYSNQRVNIEQRFSPRRPNLDEFRDYDFFRAKGFRGLGFLGLGLRGLPRYSHSFSDGTAQPRQGGGAVFCEG